MPEIYWRSSEPSRYDVFGDRIYISFRDVKGGYGPATLAHEMAHRREGIFTNMILEDPEKVFFKELGVWMAALDHGLASEELDEHFIRDTLGQYLDEVRREYGKYSGQYSMSKEAYTRFLRKYKLGGN